MAKKTKDSNLSIEERLEQALISNWDEPYKLPENWCWVKLSTVCSLENGEKSSVEDLVYLDAKTLRGVAEAQTRANGIIVNKDQKVILVDGENSGEVFVVPYRGYMGSTFKIINIAENADEMYIRYFIDQNQEKLRNSKVGSAIPHLNKDLFFNLELPFPPLSEQKRIVSHIESLFVKLDEVKKKVQKVVDGFETRKAAILHKAFSGELTKKWREENGVALTSWLRCAYSELGTSKLGKMLDKVKNTGRQVPYLRNVNVRWFGFDLSDVSQMLASEEEIKLLSVKQGDVFICEGGEPGRCAIWRDSDSNIIFQKALHRFRPNDRIIGDFLCYNLYFLSVNGTLEKYFTGSTIKHLTGQSLAKIIVSVPTIDEQKEIVDMLDYFFGKENATKESAELVIEQIDTIKKAILARAFRGELGTNDPTEASAIELIKQIIEEKIKIEESTPKRIPTKRKEVSFVAKTILEALKSSEKLTPEKLKVETALVIDDFYDQLKVLIDNGQIREIRIDGESYLEAVK